MVRISSYNPQLIRKLNIEKPQQIFTPQKTLKNIPKF